MRAALFTTVLAFCGISLSAQYDRRQELTKYEIITRPLTDQGEVYSPFKSGQDHYVRGPSPPVQGQPKFVKGKIRRVHKLVRDRRTSNSQPQFVQSQDVYGQQPGQGPVYGSFQPVQGQPQFVPSQHTHGFQPVQYPPPYFQYPPKYQYPPQSVHYLPRYQYPPQHDQGQHDPQQQGGNSWCSPDLECRNETTTTVNTMCQYPPVQPNCRNFRNELTEDIKTGLLKLHNEFRNQLAGGYIAGWPNATNMMEMTWNDEIASVAARWASQCHYRHDECRKTPNFPSVGQNLGTCQSIDSIFGTWQSEFYKTSPNLTLGETFEYIKDAGHFTQLGWAESSKLGCSYVFYTGDRLVNNNKALVCNYAPGGNVPGGSMYKPGVPASQCPPGTTKSPRYPNLCAKL